MIATICPQAGSLGPGGNPLSAELKTGLNGGVLRELILDGGEGQGSSVGGLTRATPVASKTPGDAFGVPGHNWCCREEV